MQSRSIPGPFILIHLYLNLVNLDCRSWCYFRCATSSYVRPMIIYCQLLGMGFHFPSHSQELDNTTSKYIDLVISKSCHFSIQIYVTFIDKNEWQGVRGGGGEQEQQSPRQGKRSQECRGREEKRKERECCQGVRKVKKSIQGSPKWQSRSNIYQLFCRRF